MNTVTPTFIAITGASGAGKSTLARRLAETLDAADPGEPLNRPGTQEPAAFSGGSRAVVLAEDCYYRDQSHLSFAERLQTDYDQPAALEHELLASHLQQLRRAAPIAVPRYDYAQHTRADGCVWLIPRPFVIVEGILLFSSPELLRHFDLKVWLDTPLATCLERRIDRDLRERGRSRASVEAQFAANAAPMARQYRACWQQQADLVLTAELDLVAAIDIIVRRLHHPRLPTDSRDS